MSPRRRKVGRTIDESTQMVINIRLEPQESAAKL